MELSGKVIKVLEIVTGQGKNGPWRKQEFVIEIPGTFPQKVCFTLWGDKISQFTTKEGDEVSVSFDIDSRENGGKWYTTAKAWKVTKKQLSESNVPPPGEGDIPPDLPGGNISDFISTDEESGDGLPF